MGAGGWDGDVTGWRERTAQKSRLLREVAGSCPCIPCREVSKA